MQAAPDKLIAAIPVGAKDSLEALVGYADEEVLEILKSR